MVSPRRNRTGSHRAMRGGVVALAVVFAILMGVTPSGAQPPPGNAVDAAAELGRVQHEAEALTEQWHAAKDALAARRTELEPLRAAVEPARATADAARADEETYRRQVDAVALSTFETGNLDQFNALLASGSPQEFLDQMSVLETLSADDKEALDRLLAVVAHTSRVQSDADAAVARAQAAADEAARAEQDLAARKRDAEMRIDEAERLLDRLSPRERRERNGPVETAPPVPVAGSGVGVKALRAATTQLGKPYVWGAEGPGGYDCSGLTSWAFRQAGVTLPRSSSQQSRVGKAVSFDDMRPGDLVFYYSPVSHVGIYAGEGKMINAPQSGDVVRYSTVSSRVFAGARRL